MSSAVPPPDADPAAADPGPGASAPLQRRDAEVPEQAPRLVESVERRELAVRRAPRFTPFLLGGAVLGFVVAGLVVLNVPENPQYTPAAAFGFFAMIFGVGGVGVGALLVLGLDRRSHRRVRRATADEITGTMR